MAVTKYLDKTGLTYFWSKLKTWANSLFVHLSGNETIAGTKTFTSAPVLKQTGLSMTVKDTNADTLRTNQVLHANSSDGQYGINIAFGSGGHCVVGGGEAGTAQLSDLAGNSGENLYLVADGNIYFKSNGNTWANAKTIAYSTDGHVSFENKVVTRGTNPSSNAERAFRWNDSAGNRLAVISNVYHTDSSSITALYAYKTTAATGNNIGRLGIGCDSSGNVYTEAPTPATADNSTKIATTAFVKAQGYITGSGNTTGSSGSCTGNAATATKATNDSDGNAINSTYLKLGGGTMTGNIVLKKSNITRGSSTTAVTCDFLDIKDSASNRISCYSILYYANKSSETNIYAYNTTASSGGNIGYIGIGCNSSGTVYTHAPTPATSSNDTNIATTAFVKAQGYITSSGSITGNAATATKIQRAPGGTTYVAAVTAGNSLVNSTATSFGTVWNAPTKNYRVGMATYPSNNDQILWYSVTNANVSSGTNTVVSQMYWDAGTGILTATGFAGPLTGNVTGNCSGTAANVTGTVAIANGGTGATTRLNAVKALTNENVGSAPNYFLTITTNWAKAGYTSVADAKTALGLKSAAYTESSAYATSSHTHSYLPLSGGTMTGTITANGGNIIKRDVTNNLLSIYGGTSSTNGARFELYGGTRSTNPGSFLITASIDSSNNKQLLGKPDGTLTWGGTAISLNGHTHSYLPLSGGTLTGSVNHAGLVYKSTNIDRADTTTDSNTENWPYTYQDKNGLSLGNYGIQRGYKDGYNRLKFRLRNTGNKWADLVFQLNDDNEFYLWLTGSYGTSSSGFHGNITGSSSSCTGNAETVTGTAGTSTLAWNSEVTLYTVGGHAIKAKLPANPNTDTHWTSHLYAGASNGNANAATTNGNTYLIICDNSTARDRRLIKGTGATTVTSDANGVITINSTDNNTTYSVSTTGSGNAVTSVSLSGTAITATKGSTFLTSHQSLSNYVTLNGAQNITGAKRFVNSIGMDFAEDYYNNNPSENIYRSLNIKEQTQKYTMADILYGNNRGNSATWLLRLGFNASLNSFFGVYESNTDSYCITYFDIIPSSSGNWNCGRSNRKWNQVWATTGTIQTSDKRLKEDIIDIPDTVLDVWEDVSWKQFKFKKSIEEKGNELARVHSGIIAQDVQELFNKVGIDCGKYGFFCYDEWDAEEARYDDDGNLLMPSIEADNQYSVRYEEALCIEAAYQRRKNKILENRISELENQLSSMLQTLKELKGVG